MLAILAIVAAAASAFLIGGLWYSALFAKAWQRAAGVTDDQLQNTNPISLFGMAFLVNLGIAALIYFGWVDHWSGIGVAASNGALLGVFVSACLGLNYLFERKTFALWAINSGYFIVQLTVMATLLRLLG